MPKLTEAEKAARAKARERERIRKARARERERAKRQRARERERAAREARKARAAAQAEELAAAERATLAPGVTLATHHVMVANKSKNTKPELLVRQGLRAEGLPGYRIHWKGAPGRPDICYPGRKVAIFVNGCFWHACPHCTPRRPTKNPEFWEAKFARNQARDEAQHAELAAQGWTVLVLWECRMRAERFEPAMRELAEAVRAGGAGKVVDVGSSPAWRKRALLKRLHGRHR